MNFNFKTMAGQYYRIYKKEKIEVKEIQSFFKT